MIRLWGLAFALLVSLTAAWWVNHLTTYVAKVFAG